MPFKLYYFNLPGRAEISRLIFAEAEVPFEDIRFEFADWSKHKKDMPFGMTPALEEDGNWLLGESSTIARYLANKFGLAGENEREKATIDSYYELIHDIVQPFFNTIVFVNNPERKKEGADKWIKETYPKYMVYFEELLVKNAKENREFLVGKKVSYVDLRFMNMMHSIEDRLAPEDYEKLQPFPKCKEHAARIAQRPNIAKWIASHKK